MVKRTRHFVFGVVFIALLVLVVALTVALYERSFSSTSDVTLNSERAGLTMEVGASVKLRGVEIGRVTAVLSNGDAAQIRLEISNEYMKRIPSSVRAEIIPPTAFGAKFVQLSAPTGPVTYPIRAGATIGVDHVTVEVNDTFAHLMGVLKAANPLQLNNAITALATGLDGRGEQIGQLITQIDTYLTGLNPALPNLSDDLPRLASVLKTYAGITPDLLRLSKNATVTSNTVVSRQASLDAFLISLTNFSGKTGKFLRTNGRPLANLLDYTDPVTRVVARYAPVLPCTLSGLVVTNRNVAKGVGGAVPGINTYTIVHPTDQPYTYPKNLPILGEDSGPNCHGLPNVSQKDVATPNPVYRTGANPYAGKDGKPSAGQTAGLGDTLFGALAGLVNVG